MGLQEGALGWAPEQLVACSCEQDEQPVDDCFKSRLTNVSGGPP